MRPGSGQIHPSAQQLGRRLWNLRREAGLSRQELAERAALPHGTISLLEHGERSAHMPTADVLVLLAEGLGVPPEALLEKVNWAAGEVGATRYVKRSKR